MSLSIAGAPPQKQEIGVFLCFRGEEQPSVNRLKAELAKLGNPYRLEEYPVVSKWEQSWREAVSALMDRTLGTLVLVGASTWKSPAVTWEIERTAISGRHLLGLRTPNTGNHPVPVGLPDFRTVEWDISKLTKEIDRWK